MPRILRLMPGCFLLGCLSLLGAVGAESPSDDSSADAPALLPGGPSLLPSTTDEQPPAGQMPTVDAPADGPALGDPAPGKSDIDKPDPTPPNKEEPAEPPAKEPEKPVEPPAAKTDVPEKTAAPEKTEPPATAVEPEPPKRVLTPAQVTFRDRVRRTLAYYRGQTLSAQEINVTDLLNVCLAFGCRAEVSRAGTPAQKANGIMHLCWNYPCGGRAPLVVADGHVAARIGYGLQENPSELLAVLAQSRVPDDYSMRVGQDVRSVADLVAYEKLSCRSGGDVSRKLLGLAYYVGEPSWQNDQGEQWSVARLLKEELARPMAGLPDGGTTRLLALSYAVDSRAKRKQPIDGDFARTQAYLIELQDFALRQQNADGSWGPRFIAAKSTSREPISQVHTTGRVLEWLAFSLTEERLGDPRVVKAVEYLNEMLGGQRYQWNLRTLNTRDLGSLMHALHALSTYDERWFATAEEPPKPAAPQPPAKKPVAAARGTR